MDGQDIIFQRLSHQQLVNPTATNPAEVVSWMGAVQAQDYGGAKWALGQRMPHAMDADIEQACNDGLILRTHVLRPTWHFVAPSDIRWMLALTGPRVIALNTYYYRQLELDDALFARCYALIERALASGTYLTRAEIGTLFQQQGIATNEYRLGHIMGRAELDSVVCSGPRRGKQFTYALIDERAPHAKTMERDAALAELVRRYFTSHGPATVQDFVWWSGLTVADAKAGLDMVKSHVVSEIVDGTTYWFAPSGTTAQESGPNAYLLPNFDEYTVGYTDRSALFGPLYTKTSDRDNNILNNAIFIKGRFVGNWKRAVKGDHVVLMPNFFTTPSATDLDAVAVAAERYGAFLGVPVVVA